MFELKVVKDALSIDNVEKRWPIRLLFLFVFLIQTLSMIRPVGNADMSIALLWATSLVEAIQSAAPTIPDLQMFFPIPEEVKQNYIYVIFQVVKSFFYILLIFFASSLYIGERKKILPMKMIFQYIRRLPWLLIFLFVAGVFLFVFMMFTVLVPFLLFFVLFAVPFLLLTANLIIADKKNPIDAWIYCVRYSRGKRFWLLSQVLVVLMLYNLVSSLLGNFVPPSSIGAMMIGSALFSYFLCAIGRLSGIYYYKVNVAEVFV